MHPKCFGLEEPQLSIPMRALCNHLEHRQHRVPLAKVRLCVSSGALHEMCPFTQVQFHAQVNDSTLNFRLFFKPNPDRAPT